ncbi:MAG: LysR family transcriptional regulator, partial [Chryseobacterium sp.]|nr:LysR family transcriptional regulator [Chryseobacterium sp.]
MTLNRFEVFKTVVECGSLTKAGMILGLTQSGISHTMASLENELGFSLLNRGKSGISITENGEQMLKHMREILLLNEKMLQEAAAINGIETGTVRIGTFSSVASQWLPSIIKQFQDHHPGIDTKLCEGNYLALEQELVNGEIDCAFLNLPTVKSLDVVPIKKDKMLCIVSDQHPLCNADTISFKQLEIES